MVCVGLPRFQGRFGLGQGVRVAAALERLSHPLPAQAGLCGQALQRRQPEALVGLVGEAFPSPWERLGLCVDRWQGEVPCCRAEGAGSAAARFSMPTLGARLFPGLDPGRYGDALDLRGLGEVLARRAVGTQ